MAITDEEKSLLKKEILDEIKASSQGVLELEKVTALSGVNSLPAMQGTKVVLVPLPLLSKPAEDAAAVALAAASEAADATAETEDVADVTRELAKEMAAATAQTKSATAAAEGIVAEFNAVAETALGGTSLFNVNARCGDATYTLETALQALAAQEMNDGVTYRKKGLSSPTASMRPNGRRGSSSGRRSTTGRRRRSGKASAAARAQETCTT